MRSNINTQQYLYILYIIQIIPIRLLVSIFNLNFLEIFHLLNIFNVNYYKIIILQVIRNILKYQIYLINYRAFYLLLYNNNFNDSEYLEWACNIFYIMLFINCLIFVDSTYASRTTAKPGLFFLKVRQPLLIILSYKIH